MNQYYIYKYVLNNEIIYIGQSTDLIHRIAQHKFDKLKDISADIYFFQCENKTAMNSWEYCLINKYHPKYNTALNNFNTIIDINEPDWILYQPENFTFCNVKKKDNNDKKEHKNYNLNLNILNQNISIQNNIIKNEIINNNNFIYNFYNTSMLEQRLMLYILIKSKLNNEDIFKISGSIFEYLNFLGITQNIYSEIHKTINNSQCLKFTKNNMFILTKIGVQHLELFSELDIDILISIIKYVQCKYSCFILNLLLQTENYTLFLKDIYDYLPPSYVKYSHLKDRMLLPVIEDLKLVGFNFKYNPKKTGRKYTHICFV